MSSNKQHHKHLSREDIQVYLSTQDERQKRIIEGKAMENDFDAEALDGWASGNAGISDLSRLDKRFIPHTPKGRIIFSVTVIVLVTAGLLLLFSKQQPETKAITAVNVEKTDVMLPDSVENLVELPKTELISIREVKQQHKTTVPGPHTEEKKQAPKEQVSVNQLPLLKPEFPAHTSKLSKAAAKEIYLNNLKLVDYRVYRKRPNLMVESVQLTGVPADQEKQDETVREPKVTDLEIAYYDYIKKTTDLLNEEDFKQALARCNIILTHYPDDLNALFYSGLCYYNLAEYGKAAELFKQCLTNKFSNFDEEAEWMLAKSYEASGDTEKAKAIFLLIRERGGFYSKKTDSFK